MRAFVVFLLFLGAVVAGRHSVYHKHSVHGVVLRGVSDQRLLHELQLTLDVDIWRHGLPGVRDALVMVSPASSAAFLDELDRSGVSHYLEVPDVAKALEEFDASLVQYRSRSGARLLPFENYPRHAEVNAYLERIAEQYPGVATLVTAGPSFEGRDIKYLKISTTNFTDTSKPIYFMSAMLHAREWVTTPVALYSIHRLVEDLRAGDRDLLEGTDWIVMPLVNPDGYEWSHTEFRLWRRTRSVNPEVSATCIGVDINRNFNASWNTLGVSSNPCSDVYPGHEPFSELETGYVRDIILEHVGRMQLFMDIHSHGNYVTFGFGDRSLPENVMPLHHVGAIMGAQMDAVKLPQAGFYWVGNSALLMYVTSGCAQDYAQTVGVPFSYTLELPGYGHDFRVPPEFIAHINAETWRGVAAGARAARLHYDARRTV